MKGRALQFYLGGIHSLYLSLIFTIFAFSIAFPTHAQTAFEGSIRYQIEEADRPEGRRVAGFAEVHASASRIRVQVKEEPRAEASGASTLESSSATAVGAGAPGSDSNPQEAAFILRNDLRDIVLFTSPTEAIRISQTELSALLELVKTYMMGSSTSGSSAAGSSQNAAGSSPSSSSTHTWIQTDEKKSIHGIRAVKWRGRNDDRNELIDLWLAESYTFDWTFFSGQWNAITSLIDAEGFNVGFFFENGQVPLQAEVYQNRTLVYRVTAENVDQGEPDPASLNVTQGVQVLSLTDLMMKLIMGR